MTLYKTIPIGEAMGLPAATVKVNRSIGSRTFSFVDQELFKNKRYTYCIKAIHKDGSVSQESSQVSYKVPKS